MRLWHFNKVQLNINPLVLWLLCFIVVLVLISLYIVVSFATWSICSCYVGSILFFLYSFFSTTFFNKQICLYPLGPFSSSLIAILVIMSLKTRHRLKQLLTLFQVALDLAMFALNYAWDYDILIRCNLTLIL